MKPHTPTPRPSRLPLLFLRVQQASVRQSTRDRDNKMRLEATTKRGFHPLEWREEVLLKAKWGQTSKKRAREDQIRAQVPALVIEKFITINAGSAFYWMVDAVAPLISCIALYLRATFDPPGEKPGLI